MKSYVLSADFGGTVVKIGIFKKTVLVKFVNYEARVCESFDGLLLEMKAVINEINEGLGITFKDYIGVGIAMPGIVNFKDKKLISVNAKYDSAVGFSFEAFIKKHFELEVVIENDANAALLGERALGTVGKSKFAALYTLGTGVGSAVILNGSLVRGAHNQAGCLGGHSIIDYKGRACTCGSIGCLEANASTWVLPEIVKNSRELDISTLSEEKNMDVKVLISHAQNGDYLAKKILNDFIEKWSAGLINLIHAFDPDIVVLSGGILKAGEIITVPLIERVQKLAWTPYGTIQIVSSLQPEKSVLFGMNYLVNKEFSGDKDE